MIYIVVLRLQYKAIEDEMIPFSNNVRAEVRESIGRNINNGRPVALLTSIDHVPSGR